MPPSSPVRIGLLGAGSRLRTVVNLLLQEAVGRVEVAAICDPDPLAQQDAHAAWGPDVALCASEAELLARSDLEWVFVGSPNSRHAAQAIDALRAGKHVFCEKPLAINLDDCRRVLAAVRETGRTFSFGLVLRYSPFYQKVKELLDGGVIGQLISFEFNETLSFNHGGYIFGNWRREFVHSGGHLLEKCCHDLDLANWLTGRLPVRVASFGGRNFFLPENEHHIARIGPDAQGRPAYQVWPDPHRVNPFSPGADIVDNQVAIIEYTGGVRATFHTNCHAGIPERRFYLCGTEGTIRADSAAGVIEYSRIAHEPRVERIDLISGDGHNGGDAVMARGLLATLTEGAPPLATVEDGLNACVVAFAIDDALAQGKVIDLAAFAD